MGALAHFGAVALPNTNFWDPADFTAKRRRQTELKHGRCQAKVCADRALERVPSPCIYACQAWA